MKEIVNKNVYNYTTFDSFISFAAIHAHPKACKSNVTRKKDCAGVFTLVQSKCVVAPLGSRALRKSPSRYISCVVQLFSQSCTKSRLCSERIGPNSSPVLKTRETQTGGPKMPSREGCAFYPFFPISFDKYN